MKLTAIQHRRFAKLYNALIRFVLGNAADTVFEQGDHETLLTARDSLFQNRRHITSFVKRNPCKFSPDELEIVAGWKQARLGLFYITKSLKEHTLFVESTDRYEPTGKIYGVVALDKPFEQIFRTSLPVLVRTALLPFGGKIVFDGAMTFYEVDLGSDVRQILDEICEIEIACSGIITTLEGGKMARKRT